MDAQEGMLKRIWKWYQDWRCEHLWRPALTSKGAVRYCCICEKTESISDAEFYAQFGRMPIL